MDAREIARRAGGGGQRQQSRYQHLPRELDEWWPGWVAGMIAFWAAVGVLWLGFIDVPTWLVYPGWLTGVGGFLGTVLASVAMIGMYAWGVRSEAAYGTPTSTMVIGILLAMPAARGALELADWLWGWRRGGTPR